MRPVRHPLAGAPAWCAIATLLGLALALLGPPMVQGPALALVAVPLILALHHLLVSAWRKR